MNYTKAVSLLILSLACMGVAGAAPAGKKKTTPPKTATKINACKPDEVRRIATEVATLAGANAPTGATRLAYEVLCGSGPQSEAAIQAGVTPTIAHYDIYGSEDKMVTTELPGSSVHPQDMQAWNVIVDMQDDIIYVRYNGGAANDYDFTLVFIEDVWRIMTTSTFRP
ncbi:hypothetical protein [Massilia sp. CF038]|uniref:hypothetical protein n=1 Tax=Massilia sp. CF038 TaxID=1881045 RepID=UPI00092184F7|nr:hypothetical protein [Massilia sp. CF038]SHH05394.1 hypothetical protein SAMN05428948_2532 [Massilia sp. CF038]